MSTAEQTVTHIYAADVDTVFALLSDPAFLRQRGEATGELDIDISVVAQGGNTVINNTRSVRRESVRMVDRKPVNAQRSVLKCPRGGQNGLLAGKCSKIGGSR